MGMGKNWGKGRLDAPLPFFPQRIPRSLSDLATREITGNLGGQPLQAGPGFPWAFNQSPDGVLGQQPDNGGQKAERN